VVTAGDAAVLATPPERIVDCDVRDDLLAGREPIQRILGAAGALPSDHVLRVRAIFEPAPLYKVLGKRGLAHVTERLDDDDWRVWFYRGDVSPTAKPIAAPREAAPGEAADDLVVLDVRDLEPPEPMERTLAALATLPRGKTLVQLNVRVPKFLLPRLEERGFTYEIREQAPDLVRVFIRHRHQPERQSTMADLELDIRIVPPRDKHPTIFRTFDGLPAGSAFTLINDHDPAPLRHQFEATRTDRYGWTYVERGPVVWRVRIEKK
jgi:uncharacterized protein (DUF2249 family)